ncbi:MAG: DUF2782 domain-containing protein [Candidatus Accumulibacter sp.]|jgi:hypothetical protein|nr:DUF2782 domain-containing protein [Accumulibacter sp.]
MRSLSIFLLLLAVAVVPVRAQTDAPDERPPAPLDDSVQPEVTIIEREGETVEEYRINGRLYQVKVTPLRGEPYLLIDHRGDGFFVRQEGPGTPGLTVPQWVIGTF